MAFVFRKAHHSAVHASLTFVRHIIRSLAEAYQRSVRVRRLRTSSGESGSARARSIESSLIGDSMGFQASECLPKAPQLPKGSWSTEELPLQLTIRAQHGTKTVTHSASRITTELSGARLRQRELDGGATRYRCDNNEYAEANIHPYGHPKEPRLLSAIEEWPICHTPHPNEPCQLRHRQPRGRQLLVQEVQRQCDPRPPSV
jgi:hypothetical protein